MRTTRVSLEQIRAAIARADTLSDDWQAECCEIALIPAIAKRWKELNPNFAGLRLERHEGKPHKGMTREDNQAVADWSEYAGYVLRYFEHSDYGYNSVRAEWYSHSPATAWDGMRRETVSQFIHDLRSLAYGQDHPEIRRILERAHIVVTEDSATLAVIA